MGAAGVATQAAGGLFAAYGANEEGKAQKRYYDYMAAQDEQAAVRTIQQGEVQSGLFQDKGLDETKIFKDKTAQTFGAQDAASAASGVAGSVTAQDVARDSFDRAKMDELAIRYNADSGSWAAKTEAANKAWELRQSAAGKKAAGKNARYAGKMNAISSLLGSAGQVAGGLSKYKASAPTAATSYQPDGRTVMPLPSRRRS